MNLHVVCPLTTADALRRAVSIGPDVEAIVNIHVNTIKEAVRSENACR